MSDKAKEEMTSAEYMKTPEFWEQVRKENQALRESIDVQKSSGQNLYRVLTLAEFSWTGEILVWADRAVVYDGALQFYRTKDVIASFKKDKYGAYLNLDEYECTDAPEPILHTAFAQGSWQSFYRVYPENITGTCYGPLSIASWPGHLFINDGVDPRPARCWAQVANKKRSIETLDRETQ
jgi:hypothetical protein